jgi:S1-C subfamily serine protease
MRARHWILAALLVLSCGAAGGLEAQRTPEQRARREVMRRGWIGISYRLLSESAGGRGAAVVDDVLPESPAARAGVQPGDTLLRWNGRADIAAALEERPPQPGDSLRLRVRRDGRERDLTVVAADRPPPRLGDVLMLRRGAMPLEMRFRMDSLRVHADSLHRHLRDMLRDSLTVHFRDLPRMEGVPFRGPDGHPVPLAFDLELGRRGVGGAELTDLHPGLADYFGTEHGVLVLRVARETPAARAGLQSGDVVVAADGRPVDSVRALRRAVDQARGRELRLEVVRKGERREVRMPG